MNNQDYSPRTSSTSNTDSDFINYSIEEIKNKFINKYSQNKEIIDIIKKNVIISKFQDSYIETTDKNIIPLDKLLYNKSCDEISTRLSVCRGHIDDELIESHYTKFSGKFTNGIIKKQRAFIEAMIHVDYMETLFYTINALTDKIIFVRELLEMEYDDEDEDEIKEKNKIVLSLEHKEKEYDYYHQKKDIPVNEYLYYISKTFEQFYFNNEHYDRKKNYDILNDNINDYRIIYIIDTNYERKLNDETGIITELLNIVNNYIN
jgi:hypothetical protein